MYYIGIESGDAQTAFGLFDEDGECLKRMRLPTSHFAQVGYKRCAEMIYLGIQQLITIFSIPIDEVSIGIGLAGYGYDMEVRREICAHIDEKLSSYRYVITSDVHVTLIGALNGHDGIIVIADTDSIALAQHQQQLVRCGGWGYRLGDEGSTYWIGCQLLKEFCYQADNWHSRDEIYDALMAWYQLENPYQLISKINHLKDERNEIAQLSILCDCLSKQMQPYCQAVFEKAGEYNAALIKSLVLDEDQLVTYSGSLFHNHVFKKAFLNALPTSATVVDPKYDAVVGAYIFAKRH